MVTVFSRSSLCRSAEVSAGLKASPPSVRLFKSLPVTLCDLMALEAVGHRADLSPSCPPLSSPWIFS